MCLSLASRLIAGPLGAIEKRKYNLLHWQKTKFIWSKKANKG
jgi:hypothetical protein